MNNKILKTLKWENPYNSSFKLRANQLVSPIIKKDVQVIKALSYSKVKKFKQISYNSNYLLKKTEFIRILSVK
jgi:hypothetical protein